MFIEINKSTQQQRQPQPNRAVINKAESVVTHFENVYKQVNGHPKDHNRLHAVRTTENLLRDGFEDDELREMIDFVLLSPQTRIDKEKFAMGSFNVDAFVDYIDDNIESYINGTFQAETPKQQKKSSSINRHREWNREVTGRVQFSIPNYE